jgi:hypothetical protein
MHGDTFASWCETMALASMLKCLTPGARGTGGWQECAETIGAGFKLRSRIGAGTEVELTIPSALAFEDELNGPISRWLSWLSREKFETPATNRKEQR